MRAALSWLRDHLPPPERARLLHGDLLGQNVLVPLEGAPGVIDWERGQLGDPAHDLAIMTRGVRCPFGVAGGRGRLVDAYVRAGGMGVGEGDVRFHEIVLHLGWYQCSVSGAVDAEPVAPILHRLRNLLLGY